MPKTSRGGAVRQCHHPGQPHHHGTLTAYLMDRCSCEPCRAANAARNNHARLRRIRGQHAPNDWIPALGSRRRLDALALNGWGRTHLAPMLGISDEALGHVYKYDRITRRKADQIDAIFRRLWDVPAAGRNRILIINHAKRRGALPALTWDDIDHDTEPPAANEPAIDDVAIDLASNGVPVPLTRDERIELVRRLHHQGLPDSRIAERLNITTDGAQHFRARHLIGVAA